MENNLEDEIIDDHIIYNNDGIRTLNQNASAAERSDENGPDISGAFEDSVDSSVNLISTNNMPNDNQQRKMVGGGESINRKILIRVNKKRRLADEKEAKEEEDDAEEDLPSERDRISCLDALVCVQKLKLFAIQRKDDDLSGRLLRQANQIEVAILEAQKRLYIRK